jgi:dipeptidyl aminopeptidase/acylaminoacyl peptidase
VGAAAFAGQGRLAFVSSGRLYVLDGSVPGRPAAPHAVAAPAGAVAPAWSPDGRWLAFLVASPSPFPVVGSPSGTLWLARADGAAARPVLANAGPFSWSPAADVLAATVTSPATGRAWLCELAPGMPPRLVPGVAGPATWSPDGRQFAFTTILGNPRSAFTGSMLETVPAAGGTPTVVRRSRQVAFVVAGWWPDGRGLLAWANQQNSASLAANGQALVSVPLPAGRPAPLGWTLLHPPFLATTPALQLVAVDNGGDRYLWHRKTILLCRLTGGCIGFPGGVPGPANLDPAWSPDGQALAFVHASAAGPPSQTFGQQSLAAWYATRGLWVYPLGGNPHLVSGAGAAIADPTWSADGKLLLYVRGDGLWLLNPFAGRGNPADGIPSATGGRPARIVSRLFKGAWPNYYGYIDWRDQFAWHG